MHSTEMQLLRQTGEIVNYHVAYKENCLFNLFL